MLRSAQRQQAFVAANSTNFPIGQKWKVVHSSGTSPVLVCALDGQGKIKWSRSELQQESQARQN